METKNKNVSNHCTCTHKAPGRFTFKSPAFYKQTAIRAASLPQSGTETWDFAVEELRDHHTADLFDIDGKPFRFRSDDLKDVEAFDAALRDDHRRHMNRIKEKADDDWKGKNRVQDRMIYSLMILWFALEAHDCRTKGKCSRHSKLSE